MSVAKLVIEVSAIDSASRVMGSLMKSLLGNLGNLQGPIGAVSKAWSKFTNDLGQLTPKQQQFAIAGAAMTGVGLGIAAFLADSTQKAIGYEYSMAQLNRVLDLSPAKLQQLGNDIMDISSKTQYTAQQLVDASTTIAQHGITNTDTIKTVLQNAANVAQATGSDLNTTADDMAGMMNMFPGMATNVQGAANNITGAIDAGAGSMDNLNLAMQQVGPYASSLGISFHDVSGALTTMMRNGANASSAGTGLYQMLAHLNPQTKAAKGWFQQLGLVQLDTAGNVVAGTNAFYDQHGKLKPLATIVDTLRSKFSGLSDTQLQQAASAMFTVRSSKTMNQLLESGSTSIENVTKAMDGQRSAQDKANQINDTTQGQLTILSTNWTNLQVTLGETFLPIVNKLVKMLNGMLDWFNSMPGPMKTTIAVVLALVAGLLLIAGPIIMISSLFSILAPLLTFVGGAFAFVAWPVLLVVAAIALVILITVLLITHWKQVSKFFSGVWNAIKDTFQRFFTWVGEQFSKLGKAVHAFWDAAVALFKEKIKAIGDFFSALGTWIHDRINDIKQKFLNFETHIHDIFVRIRDKIQDRINDVKTKWNDFVDGIKQKISDGITNIQTTITNIKTTFTNVFTDITNGVTGFVSGILSKFAPITDILGKIGGVISNPGKAIGNLFSGMPHLAAGGVVSSPTTALIGEAGPEAVIPLSQLGQITGSTGGQSHIHLYLDGKQLARSVDYHLAREYRKNQGERSWGTR